MVSRLKFLPSEPKWLKSTFHLLIFISSNLQSSQLSLVKPSRFSHNLQSQLAGICRSRSHHSFKTLDSWRWSKSSNQHWLLALGAARSISSFLIIVLHVKFSSHKNGGLQIQLATNLGENPDFTSQTKANVQHFKCNLRSTTKGSHSITEYITLRCW